MRTILVILCAFCVSCGPFIDANRGIVSAGFMSSTQAFSGKLRTPNGATAMWSVVGTDSTAVPIAAVQALGTGWAVGKAAQVSNFQTQNVTARQANAIPPTITQPTSVAPGTTVFPIVTPPKVFIPKTP